MKSHIFLTNINISDMNKTTKIILTTFIILINNFCSYANTNIDSLNIMPLDTMKAKSYLACAKSNRRVNRDIALECVDSSISIAHQLQYMNGVIDAIRYKGHLISEENLEKGIDVYQNALKLSQENNNTLGKVQCLMNIASNYSRLADYDKSNIYFSKCIEGTKELGNEGAMFTVKINMATNLEKMGKNEEAQKLLLEAEAYCKSKKVKNDKEALSIKILLFSTYNGLGNINNNIKDFETAIKYYKKGLEVFPENEIKNYPIYNNISKAYSNLNKLEKASIYLNKIIQGTPPPKTKMHALINLGELEQLRGNYDNSLKYLLEGKEIAEKLKMSLQKYNAIGLIGETKFKQGKIIEAEKYLLQSVEGAKKIDDKGSLSSALSYLLKINLLKKGDKKALELFESYGEISDSIYESKMVDRFKDLEIKYQTQQKQDSIITMQQKQELINLKSNQQIQQRNYGLIFLGLITSILGFGTFSFFRRNKKNEKHRKELEAKNNNIQILNRELSHRVKNNLQFLTNLFRLQGRRMEDGLAKNTLKDSEQRLQAMSLVYKRLYQKKDGDISVNLPEYIDELCHNLKLSFSNSNQNLNIVTNIQPFQLDADDAANVGLMVNELITNSVKHAFAEQDDPEISINLNQKKSGFTLEVMDNGNGTPEKINGKNHSSFGLKLIHILTEQLDGEMKILQQNPGIKFYFDFK